eukprot:COSAG05_NODE_11818_length_495_cov_0.606061_1_plen_151_part_01
MGGSRLELCSTVCLGLGSAVAAGVLAYASFDKVLDSDGWVGAVLLAYAALMAVLALLVVPWMMREWCDGAAAAAKPPGAAAAAAPEPQSEYPNDVRRVLGQRLYWSILVRTALTAGTINFLVEMYKIEHYTLWGGYPNNTGAVEGGEDLGP